MNKYYIVIHMKNGDCLRSCIEAKNEENLIDKLLMNDTNFFLDLRWLRLQTWETNICCCVGEISYIEYTEV